MSAPYWGELPPPKARRASADSTNDDPNHKPSLSKQSRARRTSAQTNGAESAKSPLISPIKPNFQSSGQASRPASLSYGHERAPSELAEKRRRRAARNQADEAPIEATSSTPPAAPDVPRAPPSSFRYPFGNGGLPYTYNSAGQPGPPVAAAARSQDARARVADMERDGFYKDATPPAERQHRPPPLDRSRKKFDEFSAAGANGTGNATVSDGPQRSKTNPGHRKQLSIDPAASQQRDTADAEAKWAQDRSPLQKLEHTLDTFSKEEKRARVEAAERRAKEKAGGSSIDPAQAVSQPARAPDQPAHVRRERRGSVGDGDHDSLPAAAHRTPLNQNPPVPNERRSSLDQPARSQLPATRARKSERIPQRNLSFRERNINGAAMPPSEPEEAAATGGLSRSGSNKLKKNPPAGSFYGQGAAEPRPTANSRVDSGPNGLRAPSHGPAVARSKTTGGTIKKKPVPQQAPPMPRPSRFTETGYDDDYDDESSVDYHETSAPTGAGRNNSFPVQPHSQDHRPNGRVPGPSSSGVRFAEGADGNPEHVQDGQDVDNQHHRFSQRFHREKLRPGRGMYERPQYLDEWKKATVGTLSGQLLDLSPDSSDDDAVDKSTAWWESGGKRRSSMTYRPKKTSTHDDGYDDSTGPTAFKPSLYLKCGPLLRYCGIRHEQPMARTVRDMASRDLEIWRGSVMIVTRDAESSYETEPVLRLFLQPIELLPPPPQELRGGQALPPEYVDPIAGIPKLGRQGETLYVKPVEHMEEAKDVSLLEPDDGLFEITRTAPDFNSNAQDPPGSFASRKKRLSVDGERLGKYKDVKACRLHSERGHTFWRFNIEVELRDQQQRIAYRINRGPATGFFVPARGQSMNLMFHSCNGFSLSVDKDQFSGPDPMWRDVLNNHQTRPFHVMIGGGDQIYNDAVMKETQHFQDWLEIKNPLHKRHEPFTPEMQQELEEFYMERYCMWFSQGLFGLANSQIPMVNMYDDHDIIDGFGSYPDHFMKSPVFSGLGNVAFKYYMLFQHQSLPTEMEEDESSWTLGIKPGPYINEVSRSLFMSLGSDVALLAVDTRTERTKDEVVREETWKKLMDRCYAEIVKHKTKHLLVVLGVPIAYPRLVWLENILTSRLMDPIKALGKTGALGNFINRFDGGVEVLDDLDDHWTAKNHKEERRFIIEDLQDLAADKSCRVTILSGDVHLAAVGQFFSNPKSELAKHKDFRYMPNIISSAIVNTPPPDLMADILNKRNKIHHFDKDTEEDMIPLFTRGVDGKQRNNKHLLPHRNWCSIRPYQPGMTPPPTPPPEISDPHESNTGLKGSGILRRLSMSKSRESNIRPDGSRDQIDRSRPPVTGSGSGFLRSLSRRRGSTSINGPGKLKRSLSLGRGNSNGRGGFFRRKSFDDDHRPDDDSTDDRWDQWTDDEDIYNAPPRQSWTGARNKAGPGPAGSRKGTGLLGLRGGAGNARQLANEFQSGDEEYFSTRSPRHGGPRDNGHHTPSSLSEEAAPPQAHKPFQRTPTGLSVKQARKNKAGGGMLNVDVENGLDICLNVEVNPKDPAGITVPYRLIVPRLWYEYQGEEQAGVGVPAAVASADRLPTHGPDERYPLPPPAAAAGNDISDAEVESLEHHAQDSGITPRFGRGLKRLLSGKGSQYRARRGKDYDWEVAEAR